MGREEIEPSPGTMIKERVRAGLEGHGRKDCVLIRCSPSKVSRVNQDSMSGRRVVQLLALFTLEEDIASGRLELAFVSLFETKRGPNGPDAISGMYHLHRTTRVAVIEVKDIERGVHLIPKFGQQIGQTVKVKKAVEEKRITITFIECDRAEADRADDYAGSTIQVSISTNSWLNVIPHYEDFS